MDRLGGLRRTLVRIGNGMHPVSAFRAGLGHHDDIRFRGVRLRGARRDLLADTALTVWAGEYDVGGVRYARGSRVVDVGANAGVFSMLAAARGAVVEAYEPHPETFDHLVHNTRRWGVECHRGAVVPTPTPTGTVQLWLHPTRDTQHSVVGMELADGIVPQSSIEVPAIPLADAIGDGCDLLKLDCEGAEFGLILESPREALERVDQLIAEFHERAGSPESLRARLAGLGFRVHIRREEQVRRGLLVATRP